LNFFQKYTSYCHCFLTNCEREKERKSERASERERARERERERESFIREAAEAFHTKQKEKAPPFGKQNKTKYFFIYFCLFCTNAKEKREPKQKERLPPF
jgi:hypothetical protein